jgi:hypothetical protein
MKWSNETGGEQFSDCFAYYHGPIATGMGGYFMRLVIA